MVTGCRASNNGEHQWALANGHCDTCGDHDFWQCDSCFTLVNQYGTVDEMEDFERITAWMSSRNQSSEKL